MLRSGCYEGLNLRRAQDKLTGEEIEARACLVNDLGEVFTLAVLGKGSVTGETRKKTTSARKNTQALL